MDPVLKQALKDIAKFLVDKELEAVIRAEIAKLPAQYAGVVALLEPVIVPELIKALDAKIDSL